MILSDGDGETYRVHVAPVEGEGAPPPIVYAVPAVPAVGEEHYTAVSAPRVTTADGEVIRLAVTPPAVSNLDVVLSPDGYNWTFNASWDLPEGAEEPVAWFVHENATDTPQWAAVGTARLASGQLPGAAGGKRLIGVVGQYADGRISPRVNFEVDLGEPQVGYVPHGGVRNVYLDVKPGATGTYDATVWFTPAPLPDDPAVTPTWPQAYQVMFGMYSFGAFPGGPTEVVTATFNIETDTAPTSVSIITQFQDGQTSQPVTGTVTGPPPPPDVTPEMLKVGNPQASYELAADGLTYNYTLTWTKPAAAVSQYLVLAGNSQISPSPAPNATSHTWAGGQPGASLAVTFRATSAKYPDITGDSTFPTLNFPAIASPWKEPRNLVSSVSGGNVTCTWDAPEANAEGVPVRVWRIFLDGGYYDQKDAGSIVWNGEANVFQYDPATEFYTVNGVDDPTRVAIAAGYQSSGGFVLSNRVSWPALPVYPPGGPTMATAPVLTDRTGTSQPTVTDTSWPSSLYGEYMAWWKFTTTTMGTVRLQHVGTLPNNRVLLVNEAGSLIQAQNTPDAELVSAANLAPGTYYAAIYRGDNRPEGAALKWTFPA